jgi:tRNA-splicing ligase RtcB (3'-phosphate/5'-hydroxy nucleic acid ligase)
MKQKLDIRELNRIEFPSDVVRSLSLNVMNRHFRHLANDEKLELLKSVLSDPDRYVQDELLCVLAMKLKSGGIQQDYSSFILNDQPVHYDVFGNRHIDHNAMKQMETVMRLPVTARGALMPDAHHGYGMPVGSVIATRNAVIPFGVGMDIGCRMAMTIVDLPVQYLEHRTYELKKAIQTCTHFGNDGGLDQRPEHSILDHGHFGATPLLKRLHGKAVRQLGTSGAGNHFVEWGIAELKEGNHLGLAAGHYTAILSHSGSRSLGAGIAQHFTEVAMQQCRLPSEAKSLAWLALSSEAGQEYWLSMNLAGEYAKACHEVIHDKLCHAMGATVLGKIGNHHNFAWLEALDDGAEYVVHRKGATPAAYGVPGIIPGSMACPGYIVTGLGNVASLNSASHGAGRRFSRAKAKNTFTMSGLAKELQKKKVTLIGGSTEEAPGAYKDIDLIMKSQTNLVRVEGTFHPRVVRMART